MRSQGFGLQMLGLRTSNRHVDNQTFYRCLPTDPYAFDLINTSVIPIGARPLKQISRRGMIRLKFLVSHKADALLLCNLALSPSLTLSDSCP